MNTDACDDTGDIKLVFEWNGNDEVVLPYEERRLEIALYVQVLEIARRRHVDISAVSLRFVSTPAG
jgi:hypothetical protein